MPSLFTPDVYDTIIEINKYNPRQAAKELANICRAKDKLVEKILKGYANDRPTSYCQKT